MKYYDANGKRRRESAGTTDKRLAEQILRKRVLEFDTLRHGLKKTTNMPYEAFSDEFLRHYRARYPYETFKSHRSVVNEFKKFLDTEGIDNLSEITPSVVNKYITYLRETKKNKANTCNNHLKNILTEFNFAMQNSLMDQNPAKNCSKVEVNDAKQKGALSKAEYELFLKIAKKMYPYYYPIFYTFLHTGLRFTELISIKWPDINFDKGILWVMKPKGKKKPEYIPIHDGVIKILKYLPRKSDYVFVKEDGKPFSFRTRKFLRRLQKILRKTGIKSISTIHELRHSFCSQLFNLGFSSREAQRFMRHSELGITEGYAHIFMPEYNKKIKRLEKLGT